ncbi:M3 family oligoendopeptidase [Clostridium polynesiense]|uniref:M3 family oligoendopeptidase n=1 Tax=Clostridium polynesiense TaxID=1325933 RepID=UPI00058FEE45|nr:M3 family oligoendopeptidase [Clostridium polynesiense]
MNLNWSLKELYDSFESDAFKKDVEKVDLFIKDYKDMANSICMSHENQMEKLEAYIRKNIEKNKLFEKLLGFIHLTLSVDTKNETALKYSDILEQKVSLLAEPDAKLKKWIGEVDGLDQIIGSSETLKEHSFYLKEIVEGSKYLLSEKEEAVISKMQNTGSNAWSKLRDLLTSTLMVDIEIEGKMEKLPLTVVRNMAYDKDPELRKKAYQAEIESYKKIEDSMAACLNGIKGEVITIAEMRGYKSPLDQALKNSRMDEDSLNAMLTAIKESLPVFRKYLRRKGELLGHKNGLPFYDLFAPMGEVNMEFPYEKSAEFVETNFRTFSDRLADFARKAVDNRWIDVKPKEGKVGGAFCSNLSSIGESRFLLNHGDTFSDVVTMAHELGHGYHGECLKEESILNADYPMPLAETASTFCETIVKKAAVKTASPEEAFAIVESEVADSTQVIVDIYSRFLFESEVFERRKESAVNSQELKEIMLNAQKEAYGEGLDQEYLHPYMWACKPHYYFPTSNFYNFPYSFGLLFAKGLYAEYLKRGESFPEAYDKLLAVTGKKKIADVTNIMNIDIHDVEFWRGSLRIIEEDIEKFLELSKNR